MSEYIEQIKLRLANMIINVNIDFVGQQPTMTAFVDRCKESKEYAEILLDVPGLIFMIDEVSDQLIIHIPPKVMH